LERNVALGAAILSAIIGIRQHPPGTTKSQAQDLISSLAYRRRTVSQPAGSKSMHTFKAEPGSLLDIPTGMEYKQSPLANQGVGAAFVTIEQALLRTVGTNWNMPEYMISGDASNANYSSTMVAESPFVKFCKRKQRNHKANCLELLWKVLAIACEAGRFGRWDVREAGELQDLVAIVIQPPIVEARDRPAETNRRKILHDDGLLSLQTWAEEEGYDHGEEVKRGAERHVVGIMGPQATPQEIGLPSQTPQSQGDAVVSGEAGADATQDTMLNGAQITAASTLLGQVAIGALASEAALELLVAVGIRRERAQKMLDAQAMIDPKVAQQANTFGGGKMTGESRQSRLSAAAAMLWEGYP
ncbi:MAG: hypothetical protein ABIH03_14600, partial [Pseudomonadota bacterium]